MQNNKIQREGNQYKQIKIKALKGFQKKATPPNWQALTKYTEITYKK